MFQVKGSSGRNGPLNENISASITSELSAPKSSLSKLVFKNDDYVQSIPGSAILCTNNETLSQILTKP